MSKKIFLKIMLGGLLCLALLPACQNEMDDYYETPSWLKGSAWDILEADGNYKVFLEGAELAGFKPILQGKSLVTVMAPNDSAFNMYLSSHGISSVGDLSTDELKRLIGFHLLYYSYDKDQLVNFRPQEGDGATDEEKLENAGLYYKYRTRSSDAPSTETDTTGMEVTVYHNERLIPVFSRELFNTKGIDAGYNYQYFYPNSVWTGNDGFNVSNAGVDEYGIVADNGYLYRVNRVVEPLETICRELQGRDAYSRFLEMYDQFSYYELDEQLTTDFGSGTDLYQHYHYPLPNIACEWPVTNYRDVAAMAYLAYSVFAPSNTAFDGFFASYWQPGGYGSLKEVSDIAMKYLLYNSVYGASVVFPEEISKGNIINSFDMQIDFDVDQVPAANRVMCENGVLYGLDELTPPGMFLSVTGPAFRYKDLSYYLYMLDASQMLVGLSSTNGSFTTLIPSNTQMTEGGISLVDGALWSNDDGELSPMSTTTMTNIVNLHTVTGGEGISSSGVQVLRTNIPYTYWYVKDGKITTSVLFDKQFQNPGSAVPFTTLHELTYNGGGWSNGRAYSYDHDEIFRPLLSTTSVQSSLAITRDESYPYFEFSELLRNAGLVNSTDAALTFLTGMRCVIFVPRNEVIREAIRAGKIPGVDTDGSVTDQAELAGYLKCYFVPTEANGMTTYPYPGSGISGEYSSLEVYTVNGSQENSLLIIGDDGQRLTVQRYRPGIGRGSVVHVVPDFDYLPFAFEDGGVHYVDGVL